MLTPVTEHVFVDGAGRPVDLEDHYEGRTPEYRVTMTTVVQFPRDGELVTQFKHYVAR